VVETDLEVFRHLVAPDISFVELWKRSTLSDFGRSWRRSTVRIWAARRGAGPHAQAGVPAVPTYSFRSAGHPARTNGRVLSLLSGLSLEDELPHPSSLSIFRGRLGVEGHKQIFAELVTQAREHGLVKDRLRLKDATHIIADVAVPTTLALLSQARDKLLAAAEPFDPVRVVGERARLDVLRLSTEGGDVEQRLVARVTHLREIVAWLDELTPPEDAQENRAWQRLIAVRRLAHKILADQDHPKAGDRTRSVVDSDVRCGKHHQWYDGYLLDVMMDPDSEIITALDVLPANGDEAANARTWCGRNKRSRAITSRPCRSTVSRSKGRCCGNWNPREFALDLYVPPSPKPPRNTSHRKRSRRSHSGQSDVSGRADHLQPRP